MQQKQTKTASNIKFYCMKWGKLSTFFQSKWNESQTILSINSDGTKCKSTDFFNHLEMSFTEIYLKNIAIIFIGFFVLAERIKFFKDNGVFTIFSSVTWLGYGWKYHKSWYITNFFDLHEESNLIGYRPNRLNILWYQITFGIYCLTTFLSLIQSIRFRKLNTNPNFLAKFQSTQSGISFQ